MRTVQADMKWAYWFESSASCTSLTWQSSDNTELSFTPLTALRFHSKDTQTLRFSLHRQSAPRLRRKTEHMSPPVAVGLPKKLPKLQIYTSLPCACKGSVWTQAIQILTSAVSLILLHLRKNEDCFPKRQTSFVISSSFFFFLCVRNSKLSSKMASQGWKKVTWF